MKLTPNERYLLHIITTLRGTAYDLWGRLNALATKRETAKTVAVEAELKELLSAISSNLLGGSHLPHPEDPFLTETQKHDLIALHRKATKANQRIESVIDLLPPSARLRKQK